MKGFGVRQNDDHLPRTPREGTFNGLWYVDLVRPLLGADGITM
jgi:hypothetical protein